MSGGGTRGQNLVHLQKVVFLCQSFLEEVFFLELKVPRSTYLDSHIPENIHTRTIVRLAFIQRHQTPGSMPGDGARAYNLEHLENVV